uniref:Uncharacterized protein n=1 Tax=Oryza glumipatula TaxID=40148 RepID=A0A0D9ZPU6_9ORYZ
MEDAIEGEQGWTLYPWEAGIVPRASRFEAGGEGGDNISGGLGQPPICVGKWGRWAMTVSPARADESGRREDIDVLGSDVHRRGVHGGCRSEEEEGPDRPWSNKVLDQDEILNQVYEFRYVFCKFMDLSEYSPSVGVDKKLGLVSLARAWLQLVKLGSA